jgi:hypothetical protein
VGCDPGSRSGVPWGFLVRQSVRPEITEVIVQRS